MLVNVLHELLRVAIVLDISEQALVVKDLLLYASVEPFQLAVCLRVVRPGVDQLDAPVQELALKRGRLPGSFWLLSANTDKTGPVVREYRGRGSEPFDCLPEHCHGVLRCGLREQGYPGHAPGGIVKKRYQ